MDSVMQWLFFAMAVLNPITIPTADEKLMVYRAMGETRGEGFESVVAVVGTMLCRKEQGYGSTEQVLAAYYAKDFVVSDEIVSDVMRESKCQGYKYALSHNDIEYLKIPSNAPRVCYGDTCLFEAWHDGR